MFKIYDGRDKFYQWDLNRKLIIDDNSINQVHYCNKTDDCSLVCEVYEEDGARLVNVPNILLQQTWRINVYAYDKEYTKHCAKFDVVARTKPADYIYTETDIYTVEGALDVAIQEARDRGEFKADKGDKGDKGDNGGYYIPTVDSAGNLSWSASAADMPTIALANIKGAKGDTGAQGNKGDKGDKGDTGAQGIQGIKGDTGDKGDTGGYYIPSIDDNGGITWSATKADMPSIPAANIKGDKGDTGAQGIQGEKGEKGDKGDTGAAGKDGADYVLTDADKNDIATLALELLPDAEEVSY